MKRRNMSSTLTEIDTLFLSTMLKHTDIVYKTTDVL